LRRIALVLLALTPAATAQELPHGSLPMREHVSYRLARAEAAGRRGDQQAQALELAEACIPQRYLDPAAAGKTCAEAEAMASRLGRSDLQAFLLAGASAFEGWAGKWDEARRSAERAVALCEGRPPSRGCAAARMTLGVHLNDRGLASDGFPHVERAVEEARAAGDAEMEALTLAMLGRAHLWLGDHRRARENARQALELSRRIGSLHDELNASWILALIEADAGRHQDALALYQEAYRLAGLYGFPLHQPILLGAIANTLAQLGRYQEVEERLAELEERFVRGSPFGFLWKAGVDEVRGIVAAGRGDHRAAVQLFATASSSPLAWVAMRARLARARSVRRLGDLGAAREAYEETIRFIEETRQKAPTADEQRATFLAQHQEPYRELIAVLWEDSGEAAAAGAFAVAEASRGRALLDALRASGLSGGVAVTPITWQDVRGWLAPNELLLTYVISEERLFGFAVSRERLRFLELLSGKAPAGLAERVGFFRQLVQESADASSLLPAGAALSKDLVAPLLAEASPEVDTLILSLDEPLHELPFDALSLDGRLLAERYDLVTIPSASVLRQRREDASRHPGADPEHRLLAVADPDRVPRGLSLAPAPFRGGGTALGPLPYSRLEVESAQRRVGPGALQLTGAAASEARVRAAEPGRFRVLHFATHALVDTSFPLRSCLLLGEGQGQDGYLRASEIYALPMAADLVVLSACETGLGQVVAGEGAQSLARAFLHSGARAVVSTLWRVGDRTSVDLMSAFYARIARGEAVGRALGAAKRELLRRDLPPRTWAGFVVSGSPDALAGALGHRSRGLVVGIGAALAIGLALAVAILVRRSRGRAVAR